MTPEEFFKTEWAHPQQTDEYFKEGIRFAYTDMINFARDYHNKALGHSGLLQSCIKLLSELGVDAETANIYDGYSHIVTDALNEISKAKSAWANPSAGLTDINISSASYMHNLKKAERQMYPIIDEAQREARIADEKTAEVYFCTHCMAFNEEDCCCSENDEE